MAPLLPTLAAHARSIFSLTSITHSQTVQTASEHLSQIGPLAARAILLAREDDDKDKAKEPQMDPSLGVTNPNDINNTFIFVLFGLIGVAFVVTGIWFFFWAKNGGFYFKENDWDDYKSTVLRRKGPNGTILSNATPSTNLGGGSVYKDVDDGSTSYTGGLTQLSGDTGDTASTLTGITAGASDIAGRERRRRAREKKEREHEKRRDRKRGSRKVGEDGVLVDAEAEADAKRNLRAYRHERAARVGGLNKASEGSEWDGSTNPEMSTVGGSELLLQHNRQSTPTSTSTPTKDKEREKRKSRSRSHAAAAASESYDTATEMTYDSQSTSTSQAPSQPAPTSRKAGGIRKVYSTADRTTTRENERLRAEARRLAEKGRAAGTTLSSSSSFHQASRRDYAYQRADLRAPGSAITEEHETNSLMGDRQHDTRGNSNGNGNGNGAASRLLPPPSDWVPESDIGDGSDLGTKSYRHYIPGISSSAAPESAAGSVVESSAPGSEYSEDRRERRKRREAQRARRE